MQSSSSVRDARSEAFAAAAPAVVKDERTTAMKSVHFIMMFWVAAAGGGSGSILGKLREGSKSESEPSFMECEVIIIVEVKYDTTRYDVIWAASVGFSRRDDAAGVARGVARRRHGRRRHRRPRRRRRRLRFHAACLFHHRWTRTRVFASFCREFEDHAPDMEAMVTFALRFNQPLNWNVSNGTNMSDMFSLDGFWRVFWHI